MPPPRAAAATDRELIYQGSMATFFKLCMLPLILEVCFAGYALYSHRTLSTTGDPTLRYISVGVPAFWAVVTPLLVGLAYALFHGQSVTLTRKAFIYRRGTFTNIMQWHEALFTPPQGGRFDRQFMMATRGTSVVVRSIFFPEFDDLVHEIERSVALRDSSSEYRL